MLEAAHIRPWAAGGRHQVANGIRLRRDLHRLFDLGYVTIRLDLRFSASTQLHQDFANGLAYYELDGQPRHVPDEPTLRPAREMLDWHHAEVFRN